MEYEPAYILSKWQNPPLTCTKSQTKHINRMSDTHSLLFGIRGVGFWKGQPSKQK